MKKVLTIVTLLALVLVVSPKFIGAKGEQTIRELYQQANQNPNIKFEIVEYNRKWFSSDFTLKLSMVSPVAPQMNLFDLTINNHLQHGPLLWTAKGLGLGLVDTVYDIEIPADLETEIKELTSTDDIANASSRMSFDGSTESFITINKISIAKDNVTAKIEPGYFETGFDMDGRVTLDGSWDGMNFNEGAASVTIGQLKTSLDQTSITGDLFGANALFEGDASIKLATVKVINQNPMESVDIEGIGITSNSEFDNDVANFSVALGVDKVAAAGQEFTKLIYDLSFEKINKAGLLAMNEQLNQASNAADPTLILQKLQETLPLLIESGPVLRINKIGLVTSSGEINTTATISIDKTIYDPQNPLSMMMAVDATASGYAPEAFFTNLGMGAEIYQLIEQKMLLKDGTNVKFEASFKNGEAMLNGGPMPLGF